MIERFWLELPLAKKPPSSAAGHLVRTHHRHSPDYEFLVETGADASPRSSRHSLELCPSLEHTDSGTRRIVAAAWRTHSASRIALAQSKFPKSSEGHTRRSRQRKRPETSALLAAFSNPRRVAVSAGDFSGFENILIGLERVPRLRARAPHCARPSLVATSLDAPCGAALANRALDQRCLASCSAIPSAFFDRLTFC